MIPEAAVEAAAKRIYLDSPTGRRTCEAWEGMDDGAQSYYRLDARRILEAAAPHIIRAAKAEAWDECEGAKYLVMVKAEGHGLVWVKDNPYTISSPYRTAK